MVLCVQLRSNVLRGTSTLGKRENEWFITDGKLLFFMRCSPFYAFVAIENGGLELLRQPLFVNEKSGP